MQGTREGALAEFQSSSEAVRSPRTAEVVRKTSASGFSAQPSSCVSDNSLVGMQTVQGFSTAHACCSDRIRSRLLLLEISSITSACMLSASATVHVISSPEAAESRSSAPGSGQLRSSE